MITIDNGKCTECGTCVKRLGIYCINKIDDKIEIDYSVCSECQKCIAVCPQMALANNGKFPERIEKPLRIKAEDFIELLKRRRSIKHFKDIKIPKEILKSVADVSQYAPTTNKKIEVIIVDDEKLIKQIDEAAMKFIRRIYTSFFKNKYLLGFMSIFSETLPVIKRKMELDLLNRGHFVKDNTQALILVIGSTRIPVTENSAQYYLSNMLLYSELIGLGSCLMDSLKIAINRSKAVKDSLNRSFYFLT